MKDGRGHVCKINPNPDGADQTPLSYRHTLSELVRFFASRRRIGDNIASSSLFLLRPFCLRLN